MYIHIPLSLYVCEGWHWQHDLIAMVVTMMVSTRTININKQHQPVITYLILPSYYHLPTTILQVRRVGHSVKRLRRRLRSYRSRIGLRLRRRYLYLMRHQGRKGGGKGESEKAG